eukprot:4521178-Amphidinium_carterae.1
MSVSKSQESGQSSIKFVQVRCGASAQQGMSAHDGFEALCEKASKDSGAKVQIANYLCKATSEVARSEPRPLRTTACSPGAISRNARLVTHV